MHRVKRFFEAEPEPSTEAQEILDYIEELDQHKRIPVYVKVRLRELIRRLAEMDNLTRCLKKEYFWREVRTAMRISNIEQRGYDRRSKWLVLWVIDIGHFKDINDVIGHDVGDKVLRRFARILRSSVRHRKRVDLVGRLGGDEFAVFMPDVTDPRGVWDAMRRFQKRVSNRNWARVHPLLEDTFYPRPDVGVVCLSVESLQYIDTPQELGMIADRWFHYADQLSYRSKREKGEPFLRCMGYNRDLQDLEEVDSEIYKLYLMQELNRRHQ